MQFQCTNCHAILRIDETSRGDRVPCIYCRTSTGVPEYVYGPNAVVDDIVILSHLASGCHSDIYRGRQLTTDRLVAVRVLKPELLSDPVAVQKFVAQAEMGSKFHHPNIVLVYSVVCQPGRVYSVMEYVHGVTLAEILEATVRLSLEPGLLMCRQIAAALNFASKEHRLCEFDLRPDKVFFMGNGFVKIALATKLEAPQLSSDCGEQPPPSGHSFLADVFRLGTLLFQTLTGRKPDRSTADFKHPLKPQAWQSPRHLNPDIPKPVAEMVLKMLHSVDGPERYDFDDLISELDTIDSGQDVHVRRSARR